MKTLKLLALVVLVLLISAAPAMADEPAPFYGNAIGAGIIDTPMHKPETHGFLKTLHPIQRIGQVSEIVDAVLYLSEATFVTGEVLHVDGGAHAGKW